jgi:diguanylate cyclase (GGDEF)-like protein
VRRGGVWTEERSDEGRRRTKAPRGANKEGVVRHLRRPRSGSWIDRVQGDPTFSSGSRRPGVVTGLERTVTVDHRARTGAARRAVSWPFGGGFARPDGGVIGGAQRGWAVPGLGVAGRHGGSMTTSEARRAPTRPLLYVALLLVVVAVVWFAVNLETPYGPQVLGRVPGTVSLIVAVVSLRRVAGTPGLAVAARRFWNQLALVTALCAVGMLIRGYDSLRTGAAARDLPAGSIIPILAALVIAVWALLRIPIGPRTTGDWIRLSLDGATVILGASTFLWYLALGPILTGDRRFGSVWAPVAIGVCCLACLSATVKVILAGTGPVDQDALRLLGIGLLVGGVSCGTATVFAPSANAEPGYLFLPIISALLILAGDRQRRAVRQPSPGPRRRGRPYSLLPYAAVAATDVLLVIATAGPADDRRHVVVALAITITGLVVVRQLVSFVDNERLVKRLREREDQLRHQASHDALTRLANRDLFSERVAAALTDGPAVALAILLVDLDDFKTINDTLGHDVGDTLLAAVAQRVQGCVRPECTVARLGGDEFAVLVPKAYGDAADSVAERVLASLTVPVVVDGYRLLVRASIGIAMARPGDGPGTLLRNADIAMYAAKERGQGSFVRYVPGMAAEILEHARLGTELRQALDNDELSLLYQPIVRLTDRRIVGAEALVRWRHPVRGLVPPGEFIPAAERTGLIVQLGHWALREACRQRAAWDGRYGSAAPATVGVNVSGRQLAEPGFADQVIAAVDEAGLQPHHLVLEVTETGALTGRHAVETLKTLHDFGVSVALDDFGTGQSSLALVRTFPVSILKLDKSFVDGVTAGGRDAAVAAAVAQIAGDIGLDAVAEGIEREEQAECLIKLGYGLGQGFHLAPPVAADELDRLLRPDMRSN